MSERETDAGFMRRALELAAEGWGRVHPNPLVGAVVVRDGDVVGEGAHREFGGPHAEVEALRQAGERARGSTVYVTLEPCGHHGKTPPCADALLDAGVARVVYAVADPHPQAAGGAERLRRGGVAVTAGVEEERARRQNALFLVPIEQQRPFVALKFGLTLDARIAGGPGERTRITGEAAEVEVHRLRAGFDAILVGAGTARVDDPRLTVRHAPPPRRPPVRVVADARATLPLDGALARGAEASRAGKRVEERSGEGLESPVWVLCTEDAPPGRVSALEQRGVRVLRVPRGPAGVDADGALRRVYDEGVRTILCEGGGRLGSALLRGGHVDRLYLFYAPVIFGDHAVPAFPGPTPGFRGRVVEARDVGGDFLLTVDRSD